MKKLLINLVILSLYLLAESYSNTHCKIWFSRIVSFRNWFWSLRKHIRFFTWKFQLQCRI